jgi:hypothetical protein
MKKTIFLLSGIILLSGCTQSPYLYDDGQQLYVVQSAIIQPQEYPFRFVYPDNGAAYVVPQTAPGYFANQYQIDGPHEQAGLVTTILQ